MAGAVNNPALGNPAAALNTPLTNAGGAGPGGLLSTEKDQKTSSTEAKFGEVLNQIQAKYGAKPEKAREIKKTLGKDDFLRIMITQMKNQDPTSPFKPEQMATEMAQFTSVEQLQNMNQQMAKMANVNQPLERMAMTNMIGKVVTIDRERFPHTEGTQEALSVNLPKDASEVKVSVVSDGGETVFESNLGPQRAGETSFTWDGKKPTTLPAKSGGYMIKVEAKDSRGAAMDINSQGQSRIIGVSFEGSDPVFLVGDNKHQEKITMRNIVRVEDSGAMAALPQAALGAPSGGITPVQQGGGGGAHFFTFKKGEGSTEVAGDQAAELAQIQAQNAALDSLGNPAATPGAAPLNPGLLAQAAPSAPVKAEGFPSGLQDPEQQGSPRVNVAQNQAQPQSQGANLNSQNIQNILKKGGE